MRYLFLFVCLVFSLLLTAQDTKKVLIIGIDGCRPDALESGLTPNLDALIANGLFSQDALIDDIPISGPGWSAILCGVWSNKHLVVDNTFTGNAYNTYPSLFKRLEAQNPSLNTYSICSWAPINDNIVQGFADISVNAATDADVAAQGADHLENQNPELSFIYFEGVDEAGHSDGFSPNVPEYISAIEVVDNYVGSLVTAIQNRSSYLNEDWLIIVTTDHGGISTEHGGNTLEERNVFVIASGNNIANETISKVCSTIADTTYNCLGDTALLTFQGTNDRVAIPSSPILNFGANQDFTLECRVRTQVSADVAIIGNKDWESGYNPGFVFSFAYPNGPEWKVNISDGTNRVDINTGGEIADDQWHTLSVTFDRDSLMSMYEDGAFVASADISGIGSIDSAGAFTIGADIFGDYGYTGAIAEVRIWDTLLIMSTIDSWQCDSITSTHPNYGNLVGYWRMNEGNGSSVCEDRSPNGNDGIIIGALWDSMDSMTVCDYSNTPRLTDILPTSFAHLCVDVETSWNLDGKSLIPLCTPSSINRLNQEASGLLSVYPNPATDKIILQNTSFLGGDSYVELHDITGKIIIRRNVNSQNFIVNLTDINPGIYYISLITKEGLVAHQVLVKSN